MVIVARGRPKRARVGEYDENGRRITAELLRQKAEERAAKRLADIRGRRDGETERRDHLRALRRAAAEAGYKGPVRLAEGRTTGAYQISVDPVTGFKESRFEARIGSTSQPATRDQILAEGLKIIDLALIGLRRNAAIHEAGCSITSPPAWAFIGHPIIRGVILALGENPAEFRPLDKREWQKGVQLTPTVHDLRLGHTGVRIEHGGVRIEIDAGNGMARVRLKGSYPDTIVTSLIGRPVGDVLGLPGMERGNALGDTPIRDAWQDPDAIGFTVSCPLGPLGEAPEGIDTSWMDDWRDRHLC